MQNTILDRMKRRQRDRRLDTLQRYGMMAFIATVALWAVIDLSLGLLR